MSLLRHQLQADPLWEFAVGLYSRPGVEQHCLVLQDEHGWDVCELLWRCWLYQHAAQAGPLPAEVAQWQHAVTRPLRDLRRQLKPAAQSSEGVANVRSQVSQAELYAERETLHILMKISLKSMLLSPLPRPLPRLEKVLHSTGQIQKKSQVSALRHIESQLDPM
ncbi:hypothetical protein AR456_00845 [Halomonas huangheensis]|nr:hypothetical protein AR456_00845 [Halomonas huangheensis]